MVRPKTHLSAKAVRIQANSRERERVHEINDMYQELLSLLPPSRYETRLSRVQILREATDYIRTLASYVNNPTPKFGEILFPHLFTNKRNNHKLSYRKKLNNKSEVKNQPKPVIIRRRTRPIITKKVTGVRNIFFTPFIHAACL